MSSTARIKYDGEIPAKALELLEREGVDVSDGSKERRTSGDLSVDLSYAFQKSMISISTFHNGEKLPDVARLAWNVWLVSGGSLEVDPEVQTHVGQLAQEFQDMLRSDEERLKRKEIDLFLTRVESKIDYWARLSDQELADHGEDPVRARMDGAVFSILVLLDGGSDGRYALTSLEDPAYEDDIAGYLHELFRKDRKVT